MSRVTGRKGVSSRERDRGAQRDPLDRSKQHLSQAHTPGLTRALRFRWPTRLLALTLLVALAALLCVTLPSARNLVKKFSARASGAASAIPQASQGQVEVVSARTRTSRTYKTASGYRTEVFEGPINYRDAHGAWQAIDNTLIPAPPGGPFSPAAGYSYTNSRSDVSIHLPSDIGNNQVVLSAGSKWVSFGLEGVSAQGSIRGDTETFKSARLGLAVSYQSLNSGLKETLTLAGPASPHSFTYHLSESAGLIASLDGSGAVTVVDGLGRTVFLIAPPLMYDSSPTPAETSSAVAYTLTPAATGQNLALVADPAWLATPGRQWPVVIDPTVTYTGTSQDCWMKQSAPNYNYCGQSHLNVGNTSVERALLQFAVNIPSNSTVQSADMALYLRTAMTNSATLNLHQLTQAWTMGATWSKYDGTNPWTTAGGTFASTISASTSVGTATGWYHWYPTQLVQGWVSGSMINDGMLLKAASEGGAAEASFKSTETSDSALWPYLTITYTTGGTVPGAPTGLAGVSTFQSDVNLNWMAPSSDGGSAITGYLINISPCGTNPCQISTGTATTYDVTGLACGTPYTFTVQAANTIGAGGASSPAVAVAGCATQAALPTDSNHYAEATLAVDPTNLNNVYAAATPITATGLVGFRSGDGGVSWSAPGGPGVKGYAEHPTTAFDNSGNLFEGYQTVDTSGNTALYVVESTDKGATWGAPVLIEAGQPDLPSLRRAASGGGMFLAYNTQASTTSQPLKVAHYNGSTWTSVQVYDSGGDVGGVPQPGAAGETYAIWDDFCEGVTNGHCSSATGRVVLARSADGGATWGAVNQIATTNLGAGQRLVNFGNALAGCNPLTLATPGAEVDRSGGSYSGRVYAVWSDQPTLGGRTHVYLSWSAAGGASWSTPVQLDTGNSNDAWAPAVTIDQSNGTIAVAWYDRRSDTNNKSYGIYYSESTNGGGTFSAPAAFATGTADPTQSCNGTGGYLQLAAAGGVLHAAWIGSGGSGPTLYVGGRHE